MIVDSSALVAVILREPDADRVRGSFAEARAASVGAPTLFETELVLCARMGPKGRGVLSRNIDEFGLLVVSFDDTHRNAAAEAYLRFGKGRHPARLNYGDCMTYAVAKRAGEPLLCVGDDFAKTDLELVA